MAKTITFAHVERIAVNCLPDCGRLSDRVDGMTGATVGWTGVG